MKTLSATRLSSSLPWSDHHVVLLPGFLGFNRLGDFTYFADTVGSAIADALARLHPSQRIAVHAFETVPAGSLADRQQSLITQLKALREQYPNARLHLVGHSTGGLDAELLLRTPRPGETRDLLTETSRRSVRSLTTIASPLAGTSLARSPLARLLAIDSPLDVLRAPLDLLLFRGPSAVLAGVAAVGGLFVDDTAAWNLSHAVLHSGIPGVSYFLSLLLNRALVRELAPDALKKVLTETHEDPALAHVRRARFVTVARRDPKPERAGAAGRLFRFLYDTTAREARPAPEAELMANALSTQQGIRAVGVPPMPAIDIRANDGIVDTVRQLLPSTEATIEGELRRLVALVIADHIDVIGYFPGADGKNNGFLTSGSDFRQPHFEELYAAVAQGIALSITDASTAGPEAPQLSKPN